MPTKKSTDTPAARLVELSDTTHKLVPHLWSVLAGEDEFIELRLKQRSDGTTLAILKQYGPDGAPMVCFGSGYGVFGALMAVDATINGGYWRVDTPWSPAGG